MQNQLIFEGVVSYPKLTDKWISFSLSQPYKKGDGETNWTRIKCMMDVSKWAFIEKEKRVVITGQFGVSEYQGKQYPVLWGQVATVVKPKQPNGASNIPFPKESSPAGVAPVKNDAVIGEEPIPF